MPPDELLPDELPPDELLPDDTLPDELLPDDALPDELLPDEVPPDELLPDDELSPLELLPELLPDAGVGDGLEVADGVEVGLPEFSLLLYESERSTLLLQFFLGCVPSIKYAVTDVQPLLASLPVSIHISSSIMPSGFSISFFESVECMSSITFFHAEIHGFPLTPAAEIDEGESKPYHTAPT